jgi:hypothetical protein
MNKIVEYVTYPVRVIQRFREDKAYQKYVRDIAWTTLDLTPANYQYHFKRIRKPEDISHRVYRAIYRLWKYYRWPIREMIISGIQKIDFLSDEEMKRVVKSVQLIWGICDEWVDFPFYFVPAMTGVSASRYVPVTANVSLPDRNDILLGLTNPKLSVITQCIWCEKLTLFDYRSSDNMYQCSCCGFSLTAYVVCCLGHIE